MQNNNGENDLITFLMDNKKSFLKKWKSEVSQKIPEFLKTNYDFTLLDFENLFDAYTKNISNNENIDSNHIAKKLLKKKKENGFPLSLIGLINAYFMNTAREIFRKTYPDAFDKRMDYLEQLSQWVLNNEIVLTRYYESYVNDLNDKFKEKTQALKRKNQSLIEFIDLATHQLQTPLWSILGFTSKLQRNYYEQFKEDGRHCLNRISANVADMHQLIESVTDMLLIDPETIKKKDLYLSDLLNDAVRKIINEVDDRFKCFYNFKNIIINGDAQHLRRLFFQILKNSAQYTHDDRPGIVHIHHSFSDGKFHLYIKDEGIGIEKEYRDLVFKPTERLKEKEISGSGMGLTFVQRIIRGHKGEIILEESKNKGLCVHLQFPKNIIKMLSDIV